MADIPHQILILIEKCGSFNSLDFSKEVNEPHQKIVGAVKSLESLGNVVEVLQKNVKLWECSEEGASLAKDGSHEARLFNSLQLNGASINDLKANFPNAGIAIGAALKNKWVKKDGDMLVKAVGEIDDKVQKDLLKVVSGNGSELDSKLKADYKKRKLIKEVDITYFEVKKGLEFTTSISKQEAELTKEMIESGNWKGKNFKPFNFKSKGKLEHRSGYLHPLMQLRAEFRQIFLEMGFTEMPTNAFVESAFWNFDALFQPQQHPARDAHDTFYVSDPIKALEVPEDYLQRVQQIHSKGGYGSQGYQYDWSSDEAFKNLLRTHTTAVSARMLYKLAQDGFKPAKYFSIDRVFRNETLDATHLAEFHQIEGVVADYNLSIKHLMGLFTAFFEKIGISKIRFKPAYNPYTEPSMEIFSYHEGLKKWVEVGNSGIFRPEMLRPMGLPENVVVIAWGLSLERPTMIRCGINNIRELVGPKVKMELIVDNAICTVDKFKKEKCNKSADLESLDRRQVEILNKLSAIQKRVSEIAKARSVDISKCKGMTSNLSGGLNTNKHKDFVIYAHPKRPPYCLRAIISILKSAKISTYVSMHCHSSVENKSLPDTAKNLFNDLKNLVCSSRSDSDICITVIWQCKGDSEYLMVPKLCVSPLSCSMIIGEHNIFRFFARLFDQSCGHENGDYLYEVKDICMLDQIDMYLDDSYSSLLLGNNKERSSYTKNLEKTLEKTQFLCGNNLNISDLVMLSTLKQLQLDSCKGYSKWRNACLKHKWGKLLA